jgi:uncharacterized integral membrane protein (TIGR00698 family)
MVCCVIAIASTFVSEHFGGPQLLYALLMGLSFHFLVANPQLSPGIGFCGRTVLRFGVALLGARITLNQVVNLGIGTAALITLALMFTIIFGCLLARWLGSSRDEGILSGGAVAICGASAAMALSSVLPQTKANERFTLLTVVGVTVMSTLAMVLYPFAIKLIGLSPEQAGIVLGGTIHDVAQVVAAGMMLGPVAADIATVVKLFRVMLLMPVVLVVAMLYRQHPNAGSSNESVPLVPGFLIAFVVLVLLSSVGMLAPEAVRLASDTSRWMLVTAIAAAGIKTSFEDLLKLGWQPVIMLVGETIFIGLTVFGGVMVWRLGVI